MNSASSPSEVKRYPIQSPDAVNFVTGRTKDGQQVIMGVPGPYVLAAFFDAQGNLVRYEVRALRDRDSRPALRLGKPREPDVAELWALVDAWQREIGFTASSVSISKFDVSDLGIGLFDLPRYLQDVLENPSSIPDEQYRNDCFSDLQDWRRDGTFVLYWGNEYWMTSSGEVFAT
jgi:hypothetical protein